jgi:serine/threonine protein kinase
MSLDHPRYRAAVPARYTILRERGRGRAGVVFEARDEESGDLVAVKITGEAVTEGLLGELCDTPIAGVVNVRDHGTTKTGLTFVVLDLVAGVPFVTALRGPPTTTNAPLLFGQPVREAGDSLYSPLPANALPRLRRVVRAVAEALLGLHARALVHGDVQPDNVLVAGETAVLIDIDGCSRGEAYRPLLATATYMSPEQGRRELRYQSDAYGLGVMLFEALTGEVPFAGSAEEVTLKKQTVRPPRPSFVVPGVPDDLDELTTGLLERSPQHRPSLADVVRELGAERPHESV